MIKIKSVHGQFLAKWIQTEWTNPVSALLLPCHKIIWENSISEVKYFFFSRSLSISLSVLIGQPNRLCRLIVIATANNVSQWKYTWIWLDWVWCGHPDWKERKGPQHILKRYLFTAVSQRLLISLGQRFLACVFAFAYSCRSAINNTHVNTLNKKKDLIE